ncbi:MAG: methyltransferase, partial [Fibrobacteria bacterium]|nr:methyltransferase [Fibrobacteria bacterium]
MTDQLPSSVLFPVSGLTSQSYSGISYHRSDGCTGDPLQDPAMALLLKECPPTSGKVLIVEGGCGALAGGCLNHCDFLEVYNSSYENYCCFANTLALSNSPIPVKNIPIDLPTLNKDRESTFDFVLFRIIPGTAFLNAALSVAHFYLKPKGNLILCGHKKEGIKSLEKRAKKLFGNNSTLQAKSHCRLALFQKQQSDTSVDYLADYQAAYTHSLSAHNISFDYISKPGIFSCKRTDPGTQLLAEQFPDFSNKKVLDLACGSGVLGILAAKLGAVAVTALDNNITAIQTAEQNFKTLVTTEDCKWNVLHSSIYC